MPNPTVEAALGQIMARLAGLERQGEATAADVREARDGVTRLSAVQEEQRVGERLEGLRTAIDKNAAEFRQDLVNVSERLTAKITAVDEKVDTTADVLDGKFTGKDEAMGRRVAALEKLANKGEGANALVQWLVKYGAWIVGGVGLLLGVKDNLGK